MGRNHAGIARRDRAKTEARMLQVSEALLERDGVLKGLNLAEVAEQVGVNRSLVYQYFGSRKGLLRRAFALKVERAMDHFYPPGAIRHPFIDPPHSALYAAIQDPTFVRLTALLHLDGDETLRLMPRLDETVGLLEKMRAEGRLSKEVDVLALHLTLYSQVMGYGLFRERMATEAGVEVTELDKRMDALLRSLVARLRVEVPAEALD